MSRSDEVPSDEDRHDVPMNPGEMSTAGNELVGNEANIVYVEERESYMGILPRPDDMERFESIAPGTLDRLLTISEKSQDHRQALELRELEIHLKQHEDIHKMRLRGQWFGLAIGIGAEIAAITIGVYGNPGWGAAVGITSFVALATAYVLGRNSRL